MTDWPWMSCPATDLKMLQNLLKEFCWGPKCCAIQLWFWPRTPFYIIKITSFIHSSTIQHTSGHFAFLYYHFFKIKKKTKIYKKWTKKLFWWKCYICFSFWNKEHESYILRKSLMATFHPLKVFTILCDWCKIECKCISLWFDCFISMRGKRGILQMVYNETFLRCKMKKLL